MGNCGLYIGATTRDALKRTASMSDAIQRTKSRNIDEKLSFGGPVTPRRELKEPHCTGDFFNAPSFSPFSPSLAPKTSRLSLLSMSIASPTQSTTTGTCSVDSDYDGNVFSCHSSPAITIKEESHSRHYLSPGERLQCGEYLKSPLGHCFLVMQYDGDLVLYKSSKWTQSNILWCSNTASFVQNSLIHSLNRTLTFSLEMLSNGNLVINSHLITHPLTNESYSLNPVFTPNNSKDTIDTTTTVLWRSNTAIDTNIPNKSNRHLFVFDNEDVMIMKFERKSKSWTFVSNLISAVPTDSDLSGEDWCPLNSHHRTGHVLSPNQQLPERHFLRCGSFYLLMHSNGHVYLYNSHTWTHENVIWSSYSEGNNHKEVENSSEMKGNCSYSLLMDTFGRLVVTEVESLLQDNSTIPSNESINTIIWSPLKEDWNKGMDSNSSPQFHLFLHANGALNVMIEKSTGWEIVHHLFEPLQ